MIFGIFNCLNQDIEDFQDFYLMNYHIFSDSSKNHIFPVHHDTVLAIPVYSHNVDRILSSVDLAVNSRG